MTMKLALLDMSQGVKSRGVPSLREMSNELGYDVTEFEVRLEEKLPKIKDYDVFISSGGPGEPNLKGKGERQAVTLYRELHAHNERKDEPPKGLVTICHSFQLLAMAFGLGILKARESRLLGVHAQRKHPYASYDTGITAAMESRYFQIIDRFEKNNRDFQPLSLGSDGALTAFTSRDENMLAFQFHPEAEPKAVDAMFDDPATLQDLINCNPGTSLEAMRARAPELAVPYGMLKNFLALRAA